MSTAFVMADYLDLDANIKYMAIHLYDKFMIKRFWELYETNNLLSHEEWREICKNSDVTKLHLLSCFQLACKMDSHSTRLEISQVCYNRYCLVRLNYNTALKQNNTGQIDSLSCIRAVPVQPQCSLNEHL